jgi:hypothetical protein
VSRLFTDDDLASLARTPHDQLADAIAAGDDDVTRPLVASLERSFAGTVAGTRNWVTHTLAFVARERSAEELAELVAATQRFFAVYPGAPVPDAPGPGSPSPDGAAGGSDAGPIADLAAHGEHGPALARFDAMEARWRALQDQYRDWLSTILSTIYRSMGIDVLEAALRDSAQRTLFDWMPTDMARAPEKRLPSWVRMLQGHFSVLRIEEDDEKFTLTQDPCGTCTRQIEQGRYGPPLDLAVVEERHRTTWFRGETPIYRAHVPLWHVALAAELVGVPWPVNQCPAGLGTGPCNVLLYKDPRNPAAAGEVPT